MGAGERLPHGVDAGCWEFAACTRAIAWRRPPSTRSRSARSRSRKARCSRSSGRAAAARPRPCAASPASRSPMPARSRSAATCLLARRGIFVPASARAIGMVFQSYAIWPHMTVFDNVAFPLRHGRRVGAMRPPRSRRRVDRVLDWCGLGGSTIARPRCSAAASSSGWRWRARSSREPRLLLLDEPLSNLDASLRDEMTRRDGRALHAPADHGAVRHPRPARSALDLRSGGDHEPGPDRPRGNAARDLRGPAKQLHRVVHRPHQHHPGAVAGGRGRLGAGPGGLPARRAPDAPPRRDRRRGARGARLASGAAHRDRAEGRGLPSRASCACSRSGATRSTAWCSAAT